MKRRSDEVSMEVNLKVRSSGWSLSLCASRRFHQRAMLNRGRAGVAVIHLSVGWWRWGFRRMKGFQSGRPALNEVDVRGALRKARESDQRAGGHRGTPYNEPCVGLFVDVLTQ